MVHGIQTKDLCGVKLDTGKSEMFAERSWRVVTQSGLLRRAAEQRASVTEATMVAGMIVVVTTPATAAACDHAGNWLILLRQIK